MAKLLPNLPIEDLTEENDYIGIIEKGDLIKSFFLSNKDEFSRIKFFSIYGEWGSGKSTLMKYLQKELKGSFNTFFFESWEFESDNNLANSLLEFLVKESSSSFESFLDAGNKLLKGFAKSVVIKTPVANIDLGKSIGNSEELTFYELKENFKKEFTAWENKLTDCDKCPKYNIVFIDDLDRCEPENVLNLLSAIKLFFTFGEKTIFFCGIDKKAVYEAVKTKYGEVIKSNEYLEKVFDISFTMPKNPDVSKLVNIYFDESEKVEQEQLGDLIYQFFEELHFTNPRRIKKILNKYLIIKRLKETSQKLILPNIIHNDTGTLFETYLTLYLLILKEFEPKNFENLFNLNIKRLNYSNSLKNAVLNQNEMRNIERNMFSYFREESLHGIHHPNGFDLNGFFRIYLANLAPLKADLISSNIIVGNKDSFIKQFGLENKGFEYYFTIFMFENEQSFTKDLKMLKLSLMDYKKIIENLI